VKLQHYYFFVWRIGDVYGDMAYLRSTPAPQICDRTRSGIIRRCIPPRIHGSESGPRAPTMLSRSLHPPTSCELAPLFLSVACTVLFCTHTLQYSTVNRWPGDHVRSFELRSRNLLILRIAIKSNQCKGKSLVAGYTACTYAAPARTQNASSTPAV
jgi:hypothetical protein